MRLARPAVLLAVAASAAALSACGSAQTSGDLADSNPDVERGAQIFSERCQGCHTLDVVAAEGSATKVRDRERVDGPNFNVRKEQVENVLYAIRNGGYSGAIMPENIVVGSEADDVAQFLAKYSGLQASQQGGASDPGEAQPQQDGAAGGR
jgi:mono/diheme cytochrome c family protein